MGRRHPWLVGTTCFLALCALVAAVSTDVFAHRRERAERAALAAAGHGLASDRAQLVAIRGAIVTSTARHRALQASIGATAGQLSSADASLARADAFASLQGAAITSLQACLGGVEGAYQAIAADDDAGAARSIATASGPCLALAGGDTHGLVYPFDFPDPDVVRVGDTYFAYATNSVAGNIQIIESNDLTHWTLVGNALPALPSWAVPDATWAPGVTVIGGKVLLYYAAEVGGQGGGEECVSVAVASQPKGPFVDSSTAPLECQPSLGGSLDPFPFVDGDGTPYLLWKSNDPATIWSQQLDPTATSFAAGSSPTRLLVPDQPWEGGNVEAPDMVATGGRYLLFFSGNNWSSQSYAVGSASCSGPLGPCSDVSPAPVLATGPGAAGPGGESVFADGSGAFWIAFHAYIPGAVGYPNSRDLFIRPLDLSGSIPVVGGS